jgi:hypothetical protein
VIAVHCKRVDTSVPCSYVAVMFLGCRLQVPWQYVRFNAS